MTRIRSLRLKLTANNSTSRRPSSPYPSLRTDPDPIPIPELDPTLNDPDRDVPTPGKAGSPPVEAIEAEQEDNNDDPPPPWSDKDSVYSKNNVSLSRSR